MKTSRMHPLNLTTICRKKTFIIHYTIIYDLDTSLYDINFVARFVIVVYKTLAIKNKKRIIAECFIDNNYKSGYYIISRFSYNV